MLKAIANLLTLLTITSATNATQPMPELSNKTHDKNTEIRVVVIDTGFDFNHEKLKGLVEPLRPVDGIDTNGHGTHVTGLVVYGRTIASVAPKSLCKQVKIYHCNYFSNKGSGIDGTIECLRMAKKIDADYVNYSSYGPGEASEEKEAWEELGKDGTTLVVSAGNEGVDLDKIRGFPASYTTKKYGPLKGMVAVSNGTSFEDRHKLSGYSENSVWVDGRSVFSTLPHNKYGFLTGTSQSAPLYLHKLLTDRCNKLNPNGW